MAGENKGHPQKNAEVNRKKNKEVGVKGSQQEILSKLLGFLS